MDQSVYGELPVQWDTLSADSRTESTREWNLMTYCDLSLSLSVHAPHTAYIYTTHYMTRICACKVLFSSKVSPNSLNLEWCRETAGKISLTGFVLRRLFNCSERTLLMDLRVLQRPLQGTFVHTSHGISDVHFLGPLLALSASNMGGPLYKEASY